MKTALIVLGIVVTGCCVSSAALVWITNNARKQAELANAAAAPTEQPGEAPEEPREPDSDPLGTRQLDGRVWSYDVYAGPMDPQPTKIAAIFSRNVIELGRPYEGPQRGRLTVREHPRHGRDIIFDIPRGQMPCRIRGCRVQVRFDEATPRSVRAVGPSDGGSTSLFLRGFAGLVRKMKRASLMRIEAEFYRQGNRVFEFNVEGFEWPPSEPVEPEVAAAE